MNSLSRPIKRIHVGIVGPHGRGKSTLADDLAFHLLAIINNGLFGDFSFKGAVSRINFADTLRHETLSGVSYTLTKERKYSAKERVLLQAAGELEREFNSTHFVSKYLETVNAVTVEKFPAVTGESPFEYADGVTRYNPVGSFLPGLHVVITDDAYHLNKAALMDVRFLITDDEWVTEYSLNFDSMSESEHHLEAQLNDEASDNVLTYKLSVPPSGRHLTDHHLVVALLVMFENVRRNVESLGIGPSEEKYSLLYDELILYLVECFPEVNLEGVFKDGTALVDDEHPLFIGRGKFYGPAQWKSALQRRESASVPEHSPELV